MSLSRCSRPLLACPPRLARLYSELASAATHSALPDPPPQRATSPANQLPYLVRRNTKGSIPVYTDIRNGGTRYLVLIRNVQGNADALADDLSRSLFPAGTSEAARMRVHTVRQRHVVLSGGRWKNDVVRWLVQKGF
ncbi:mitochondrial large subunit ribosomal protein-domain-containing protein [Dichomitus squalens]|uniref:Large ribosomal subunit protein mL49 n=1 Tax=Dichomitus squalens TaxID=114155 RepID=A0A4Q9MWC5_9APHY|nr:mitochondrial large subunit ribosomal protein-domain-containing protein [Dichomitus squalens]